MDGLTVRQRIRVTGTVQGVGFRPFVHRLAHRLGVVGFVGNDAVGVFIEAQAAPHVLTQLQRALRDEAPPLAHVDRVMVEADLDVDPACSDFSIVASTDGNALTTASLPPDTAMCADCRAEVRDPGNRRYRHPFATCTNCGPRFTITTALPYDRPNTTMAGFPMCAACFAEYHDPGDRRFHAQPIACNECGPELRFHRAGAADLAREAALAAAIGVLRAGGIVAVKGLGGYHLTCRADDAGAVARLRERKQRGNKPFAVMARDLDVARRLALVDADEAALLTSPQAPIVLLRPTPAARDVAEVVAPGNGRIGIMLPPTPLHLLLLSAHDAVPGPPLDAVVLTSCNLSDEPICIDDERALADFAGIADAFLLHDRRIHLPCDDSVMRITTAADGPAPQPVRRSRGYAPSPLLLPTHVAPTLAVGGELKTTLCVATGDHAWMSQHIGDTGDLATLGMLDRVADVLLQIQRVRPQRIVADRHPAYLSRRWALDAATRMGAQFVDVQHHHAHMAALLAEHRVPAGEPVLAVTFDGTGYGADGSIWGGEFLLGSYGAAERVAALAPVALPGGDAAVKRPARIALAHLVAAGVAWDPALPPVAACAGTEADVVRRLLETGTSCVPTTSAGRLFDAVSALAGGAQDAQYEGQAAIELEALAAAAGAGDKSRYVFDVQAGGPLVVAAAPVIAGVARDVLAGVDAGVIGRRFHEALAAAVTDTAVALRRRYEFAAVGLTGGVFQNALLTQLCAQRLVAAGFRVLVHRAVPANDGGLALGQVMVAEHSSTTAG